MRFKIGQLAPWISLLLMNCNGVVHLRVNASRNKELHELIALGVLDDIEMIGVAISREFLWQLETGALETFGISFRPGSTLIGPFRYVFQLHAQKSSVQIVQPAIEAKAVDGALQGAVVTQPTHGIVHLRPVGEECAAIAIG